jgi:hypothetical protein
MLVGMTGTCTRPNETHSFKCKVKKGVFVLERWLFVPCIQDLKICTSTDQVINSDISYKNIEVLGKMVPFFKQFCYQHEKQWCRGKELGILCYGYVVRIPQEAFFCEQNFLTTKKAFQP